MVPWSPPQATTSNGPNQKKNIRAGRCLPSVATSSSVNIGIGHDQKNGKHNGNHKQNHHPNYHSGSMGSNHGPGPFRPAHNRPLAGGLHAGGLPPPPAEDPDEDRCAHCHSATIITDWKQGDRVCTTCGIVAEEKLMDDRPEWKNFSEAEDLVRGLPSGARSGLVPVDETRYVGGLQPTVLSRDAFGANTGGFKMARIRRQLKTTGRRVDHCMEKAHKRALQDARLERRVRLKREKERKASGGARGEEADDAGCEIHREARPEFDLVVLQEEEDMNRLQAAIYADKWSLDRAVFLWGDSEDQGHREAAMRDLEAGESREDLLSRMDKGLREASKDLHASYAMVMQAARTLGLPTRVADESVHRLVRYASRRDGFLVKGVSSRLPKATGKEDKEERKLAAARLREYNKAKQISALGASVLFLTARSLGWTRTVLEICDCFRPSLEHSGERISIKAKHCFRAMNEIKTYFPEYTRKPVAPSDEDPRSAGGGGEGASETASVSNFADHFVRNLQLPPVAEASVRALLVHCRHEQVQLGRNSGVKLATLCASVVYFVCTAGGTMQRIAQQQVRENAAGVSNPGPPSASTTEPPGSAKKDATRVQREPSAARVKPEKADGSNARTDPGTTTTAPARDSATSSNSDSDEDSTADNNSSNNNNNNNNNSNNDDDDDDDQPFDVFTHAPIPVEDHRAETLEYEMRRMWDAWAEQMPWSRSLLEIEQACGVTAGAVRNLYKSDLYPRRGSLLEVLNAAVLKPPETDSSTAAAASFAHGSDASLHQTPMASILLAHISTAGALMSNK
ncbi:unnamed protein product [Pseudo-nitzschia multistriata]|uniref:General transcription factor TFIIB n=1 Tax=Pseudo-nitzschia multistriata TaxID=183589 RepID=A0A448ZKL5_9STRA|nr:unnamed protein product [Pseudo-nitzschia multistriata]